MEFLLNLDPVIFSIGPFAIRWYALAYIAGFMLGWRYCLYIAGLNAPARPHKDDIDDFLPWVMVGVILGGRIGYILFYQSDLYMRDPLAIFKIWQGGMSFHGGALGVAVSMLAYAHVKKFSVLRLADMVAAAVPIGIFFGRIANFINGELFGRVTDASIGIVFPRGGELPRHPSQLYEAALEGAVLFGVLFWLLQFKSVRNRPGILAGAFLIGYGCFRNIVELFREPDVQLGLLFDVISMGQLLSLPMVILGAVMIVFASKQKIAG